MTLNLTSQYTTLRKAGPRLSDNLSRFFMLGKFLNGTYQKYGQQEHLLKLSVDELLAQHRWKNYSGS
jgi:hypothetical protein